MEQKFYFSLQAQTPEGTVDSLKRYPFITPTYEAEINRSIITFEEDQKPALRFNTTYLYLSMTCLRISLWSTAESSPEAPSNYVRRESIDIIPANIESKEENFSLAIGTSKDLNPLEKIEVDPLHGECFIPFLKILGTEMTVLEQPYSRKSSTEISKIASEVSAATTKLEKSYSENLWNYGKLVGRVSGKFIVTDPPFLKQMHCGVHTESGFSFVSSSVLMNDANFGGGFCGLGSTKIPSEVF